MLRGIWANDTTIWVADSGTTFTNENGKEHRKILAYNWTTKQPNTNKNFNLASENDAPRGLWSDTVTMWVADANGTVYAYKMSDRTPDTSKKFNLASTNGAPRGIWSNGKTMWVADSEDVKLYAYKMSNKERDLDKDFDADLLRNSGNTKPDGLWSDGETMWVANNDTNNAKIYAYKLTGECRESGMDFDTLSAVENNQPSGLWSNDTTMWVLDSDDKKLYAYNQPLSGNALLKSLSLSHVYIKTNLFSEVFSKDAPHYTDSEVRYEDAYVIHTTASTTVTANASDSNAGLVIQPTDADLNTAGHQVNLANVDNNIIITVTAENGNIKQYTVTVARDSGGYTPIKNFNLAEDNSDPMGLWSNGTNMWVLDLNDKKFYVYEKMGDEWSKRDDGTKNKEFGLVMANSAPGGIWSDKTTMWVSNYQGQDVNRKLYAYNLEMKGREADKDFALSLNNRAPKGLWSDEKTLLVSDSGSKIYAYDLKTENPTNYFLSSTSTNHYFDLHNDNANPKGIWSNGTTLWVANNPLDEPSKNKIYAYNTWTTNQQKKL